MIKTIELDCAPGTRRPGDYLVELVRDTPIENHQNAKPDATSSRLFGCWTWTFNDVPDDEWKEVQSIIKPRIIALYDAGRIRFGSW